jgi:hypothetical protein
VKALEDVRSKAKALNERICAMKPDGQVKKYATCELAATLSVSLDHNEERGREGKGAKEGGSEKTMKRGRASEGGEGEGESREGRGEGCAGSPLRGWGGRP